MCFKKYLKKFLGIGLLVTITSISFLGCGSDNKDTIKIATKPMTEQFILGEMLGLLIEDSTDLNVEITKGVGGGTSNIHPAIIKGDFDLYPEYTGTAWSFVLKEEGIPDTDTLYKELTEKYKSNYNLKWVGLYGFNNTYGLEFKSAKDMDIGLKYQAINSKEIDIMNVFTTDGQLSASDVVLLEDNRNFYETYYCGTVVREAVLEANPNLEEALKKMDNDKTVLANKTIQAIVTEPGLFKILQQ